MGHDIRYLLDGTPRQRDAYHALRSLGILDILRDASPRLVGTIPLDIDVPGSDLDIICEMDDADAFARRVETHFGTCRDFTLRRGTRDGLPVVVANWQHEGFPVELFAQPRPVTEQNAYVHMVVEHRLLRLGDPRPQAAGPQDRTGLRPLLRPHGRPLRPPAGTGAAG